MCALGQDPTLLIVTNVALGVICALFWLWILAAIAGDVIRRWRTRASLPSGWPPDGDPEARKPVVPDVWPPTKRPINR